jgi:hypothetical protein
MVGYMTGINGDRNNDQTDTWAAWGFAIWIGMSGVLWFLRILEIIPKDHGKKDADKEPPPKDKGS